MIVQISALLKARIRQATITNVASDIFSSGVFISDSRTATSFLIQNNSANDLYMGFDNTVTVAGGANPGIKIPAGGQLARGYGARIMENGIWLIGTNAGGDSITIEEAI